MNQITETQIRKNNKQQASFTQSLQHAHTEKECTKQQIPGKGLRLNFKKVTLHYTFQLF